ncbi:calpain-like cysteine peptidase [Novymonas esmeraldas]|uniref:Calpain-like cysteine peptidase n=1 Tax=Novymonas esmeraldas TaxID=1808958 RepID=A0AAW0EUI7_9TRYP
MSWLNSGSTGHGTLPSLSPSPSARFSTRRAPTADAAADSRRRDAAEEPRRASTPRRTDTPLQRRGDADGARRASAPVSSSRPAERVYSAGGLRALSAAPTNYVRSDDDDDPDVAAAAAATARRDPPESRRAALQRLRANAQSGAALAVDARDAVSGGAAPNSGRMRPRGSVQEYVSRQLQMQSEQGIRTCGRIRRPLSSILVKSDAPELPRSDTDVRRGVDMIKTASNATFWKRTLSKHETDVDLPCYNAYEHILAFYYAEGKEHDDSLEVTTPDSSQRRQRDRVARVLGGDAPGVDSDKSKQRSKGPISASERRASMTSATVDELYERLTMCYRSAGVAKGYLDTLFMQEVLHGDRAPREYETEREDKRGEHFSIPSSDGGEEVEAPPPPLQRGGRGSMRNKTLTTAMMTTTAPATVAAMAAAAAAAAAAKGPVPPPSGYERMLEEMRAQSTPAFFHHNAISAHTLRFLKKRGVIGLGQYSYVLRLWDDEEHGYLATSVFDRKPGFAKQFKDSCTHAIYGAELSRDWGPQDSEPVLVRQHLAPGARKHFPEEGKLLRGHTIIRDARALDIFDGRVCEAGPASTPRDFRLTAIHASIQALAHYDHLFPNWGSLRSIIHPQDNVGRPVVNPVGGMYCLSIVVNGAVRLVKVDDRVPVDPDSGQFRCLTSATFELYPALLEKGLLKANGCGVNLALTESAAVLFQLCGWIPELIRFRSNSGPVAPTTDGLMVPSEMWEVLMEGYNRGRLIMTLTAHWSDGRMPTAAEARRTQSARWFVPPVVYPVLDMITQRLDGSAVPLVRALMLRDTTKDPASRTFEPPFTTSLTPRQLLSLGYTNTHRESGVFCVTWEEAIAHFDHCSVSWNPSTYWDVPAKTEMSEDCTRLCCHGVYNLRNAGQCMARQPQFHICSHLVSQYTHLFLVFCPHTANQPSLPLELRRQDRDSLNNMYGGGVMVRLRVYETSTLPSLTQCKTLDTRGRPASCSFGDCHGRRIVSETEGPRGLQPLAVAQGRHGEFITLGFDCLPGTREYVVVMDVESPHNNAKGKSMFPYTLTLFTCLDPLLERNPNKLPMCAVHAQHATLVQAKQAAKTGGFSTVEVFSATLDVHDLMEEEAQRQPPEHTITMHAIPENPNLNSRTVQSQWSSSDPHTRTVLMQHDNTREHLSTGTQFYFHLDKPEHVSLRMCPSRRSKPGPPEVEMKLLLVRRTRREAAGDDTTSEATQTRRSRRGGGGGGGGGGSVAGHTLRPKNATTSVPRCVRGDLLEGSDIALCSGAWSHDGAVIDTVSPHTVLRDRDGVLVQNALRLRQLYHTSFNVAVTDREHCGGTKMNFFLVSRPNPREQMRYVILQAFADGFLISPHACSIGVNGDLIPHDTEVSEVLASHAMCYEVHEKEGGSIRITPESALLSLALPVPQLELFVDVDLQSTAPAKCSSFTPDSNAWLATARLRAVVRAALSAGPAQRMRLLRTIFCTMTWVRRKVTNESHLAFLEGLGESIEMWLRWHQNLESPGLQTPPLSLPPLPAGDYVVIPCIRPLADDTTTAAGQRHAAAGLSSVSIDITLGVTGGSVELLPARTSTAKQSHAASPAAVPLHAEFSMASVERALPLVDNKRRRRGFSLARWVAGTNKCAQ